MALVTDAGMPSVSDPGSVVVRAVVDAGLPLDVVPGPTAATTAIALAAPDSARWSFEGFLPRKGPRRRDRLRALADEDRPSVVYEAPARVARTLGDLAEACGRDRPAVVTRELTKLHQEVDRGSLGELAERWSDREARGEFVLVVDGAPAAEPPGQDEVDELLLGRLAQGASTREAADAAAAELGIGRRDAYERALELRR